jgi:hypothetical protein
MFEALPGLAWVAIAWVLAMVCTAAACARWFRYLRDVASHATTSSVEHEP